ncbi:MAG: thioredoxin domain-containing protein [Alphaproteobacteria bacterium]|nr:MAG: thioredoxin domain-containing protein [Alphaproteobacteria bacterium]
MPQFLDQNRLAGETSPYLLQHETNPVHWQPWEPEVLAAAQALDKPILLSVGYAACHWCHVMAHESFEDEAVAALMNDLFVNIKVDREERPDLDALYQKAFNLIGGQGGWPLTMFLSPDGEPFWGGTYFPKESAYGRPGFKEILVKIAELYRTDKAALTNNVTAIRQALEKNAVLDRAESCPADLLPRVAAALGSHLDPVNGGLKGAPKFPQATLLRLFQEAALAKPQSDKEINHQYTYEQWLTALCQGGIYDHVGGGFARYCVDENWLVPHFEKMLYDNAQILTCLTAAWRQTRAPLYKARAEETVTFLLAEMRNDKGAFVSSYDADSEGEEGAFYVWRAQELAQILGDGFESFAQTYDVTPNGNWEGKTILNRLQTRGWLGDTEETDHRRALTRLRAARQTRVPPGRDDKILTDWNGLMIRALAEAAFVFDQQDWLAASIQAFDFIVENMSAPKARLLHSWASGRAHIAALAEDYANMAAAALALFEVTGKPAYLDQARNWCQTLEEDFWDPVEGGFFQSPHGATDLIHRSKPAIDAPCPAVNGTMVEVYARLEALTGQSSKDKIEGLVSLFAMSAMRNPVGMASLILGFDFFLNRTEVIILGGRADPQSEALLRAVAEAPLSHPVLQVLSETENLPQNDPAKGKTRVDGKPTLYLCRHRTCAAPITDPAQVAGNSPPP